MARSSKREPGEKERFAVLLEEVRDDVKRVAEGHTVLQQEIAETRRALTNHIDQLEHTLGQAIVENSRAIHGLTERFDVHERAHAT